MDSETVDTIIRAVLDNPNYVHLKKKIITLPGRDEPFVPARKMILLEACNELNFLQGSMIHEITTNETLNDNQKTFGLSMYASLAPFSFGDVPTLEQMGAMLDEDTVLWIEAMKEINPHKVALFYPNETEKTKDEVIEERKKKSRKRSK